MNLTSTKRQFTQLRERFCQTRLLGTTLEFKGTVQSAFGAWLQTHWALANSGWFPPVARDFYLQRKSLEVPLRSRPRLPEIRGHSFSPTIKLTCLLQNSRFEFDGPQIFETVGKDLEARFSAWVNLFQAPQGEKLSNLYGNNADFHVRETAMIFEKSADHTLEAGSTRLRQFLMLLFPRVSRTATQVDPQSMTSVANASTAAFSLFTTSFGTSANQQIPIFLDRSSTNSSRWLITTRGQGHVDHLLLIERRANETGSEINATPRFSPTLARNFGSAKVAAAELVNQRIAHFISSPALTYAKRQDAVPEGIVHALRDLKNSRAEQRPVAIPQLPSVEQLTSQVRNQLERELRIEKERRGL